MGAALPPPTLEVYYSPACAPCRLELPAVAEFVREDGARVRIAIVGDDGHARSAVIRQSPSLAADAIDMQGAPRTVLRAAGDADAILPYARVLTNEGSICARWRGILTVARARALVATCVAISRPSHRP